MRRTASAILALLALVAFAPNANAGSHNGTRDWYWHKACWVNSTTNLDVTNWDAYAGGWTRQKYHIDADKGSATSVKVLIDGRDALHWNDFYAGKGDWSAHTITLVTNRGTCSVRG